MPISTLSVSLAIQYWARLWAWPAAKASRLALLQFWIFVLATPITLTGLYFTLERRPGTADYYRLARTAAWSYLVFHRDMATAYADDSQRPREWTHERVYSAGSIRVSCGAGIPAPIVVDSTPDATARVSDRFREVQWSRLGRGDIARIYRARPSEISLAEGAPIAGEALEGIQALFAIELDPG